MRALVLVFLKEHLMGPRTEEMKDGMRPHFVLMGPTLDRLRVY